MGADHCPLGRGFVQPQYSRRPRVTSTGRGGERKYARQVDARAERTGATGAASACSAKPTGSLAGLTDPPPVGSVAANVRHPSGAGRVDKPKAPGGSAEVGVVVAADAGPADRECPVDGVVHRDAGGRRDAAALEERPVVLTLVAVSRGFVVGRSVVAGRAVRRSAPAR